MTERIEHFVTCPACGNDQVYKTKELKVRAHTNCKNISCKYGFYVMPNLSDLYAEKGVDQTKVDTFTDRIGRITIEDAESVPKSKVLPYAVTFNPTDRSFVRTMHLLFTGHTTRKPFDEVCDKLIHKLIEFKLKFLEENEP